MADATATLTAHPVTTRQPRLYQFAIWTSLDPPDRDPTDDGTITGTSFEGGETSLYLGNDSGTSRHLWFRIPTVNVPPGATIQLVILRLFFQDYPSTDPPTGDFVGTVNVQNEDDPGPFLTYSGGTQAWVDRDPVPYPAGDNLPRDSYSDNSYMHASWGPNIQGVQELSTAIQYLIDQPGWVEGNAILLWYEDTGTAVGDVWRFAAHEIGNINYTPYLDIRYFANSATDDARVWPTAHAVTTTIDTTWFPVNLTAVVVQNIIWPDFGVGTVFWGTRPNTADNVTITAHQVTTTRDDPTTTGIPTVTFPLTAVAVTGTVVDPHAWTHSPHPVPITVPSPSAVAESIVSITAVAVTTTVEAPDAVGADRAPLVSAQLVQTSAPTLSGGGNITITHTSVAVTTTIDASAAEVVVGLTAVTVSTTIGTTVGTMTKTVALTAHAVTTTLPISILIGVLRDLAGGVEVGRYYRLDEGGGNYRFRLIYGSIRGRAVGYQSTGWERVSPRIRYDDNTKPVMDTLAWNLYVADPGQAAATLYASIGAAMTTAGFRTDP